jgi:hypothetical protein
MHHHTHPANSAANPVQPTLSQSVVLAYQHQGTTITATIAPVNLNQNTPFEVDVLDTVTGLSIGSVVYANGSQDTNTAAELTFTVFISEFTSNPVELKFTNKNPIQNGGGGSATTPITITVFTSINIFPGDNQGNPVTIDADGTYKLWAYMVVAPNSLWPAALRLTWGPTDLEARNYIASYTGPATTSTAWNQGCWCQTEALSSAVTAKSPDGGIALSVTIVPVGGTNGIKITELVPFGTMGAPWLAIGNPPITVIAQDNYDGTANSYFPFVAPKVTDPSDDGLDSFSLYAQLLDNGANFGNPVFLNYTPINLKTVSTENTVLKVTQEQFFPVAQMISGEFDLYYVYTRISDGSNTQSIKTRFTLELQYAPNLPSGEGSSSLAAPQPNPTAYTIPQYLSSTVLAVTVPLNGTLKPKANDWVQVCISLVGATTNTNGQATFLSLWPYKIKASDVAAGQIVFNQTSQNNPLRGFFPAELYPIEKSNGIVYYLYWHGMPSDSSPKGEAIMSRTTPILVDTVKPHSKEKRGEKNA